jgi:NAD(P)-dependent dehydrogenase (short-subunit alcohol dehydrogenase family)
MGLLDGKVAVVTGAGHGVGRGEALELAAQGARVVVNDLGVSMTGEGSDKRPADEVVGIINDRGGEAVTNYDDVGSWAGAENLVNTALDAFGALDIVVNNAGILRDKSIVKMTEEEWDAVLRVHLKGTFNTTHFAGAYWQNESKEGRLRRAAIVNTVSSAGLQGNPGQANYGAAKAGIAAFTQILGEELWRYGVLSNAIAPSALTGMTESLTGYKDRLDEIEARTGWKNPGGPEHIVALVVWLGSPLATVNGRVFNVRAGHISVAEGWNIGPAAEKEGPWSVAEVAEFVPALLAEAAPQKDAHQRIKSYGA